MKVSFPVFASSFAALTFLDDSFRYTLNNVLFAIVTIMVSEVQLKVTGVDYWSYRVLASSIFATHFLLVKVLLSLALDILSTGGCQLQ